MIPTSSNCEFDFENFQPPAETDNCPFKIDTSVRPRSGSSKLKPEQGTPTLIVQLRRPRFRMLAASLFWIVALSVSGVGMLQESLWGLALLAGALLVAVVVIVQFSQYTRGTAQVILTDVGIWTPLEFIEWSKIDDVSIKETRAGNLDLDDVRIKVRGSMLPTIISTAELECSGVSLASAIRTALQRHAGWSEYRKLDWNVDGNRKRI